MEYTKLGRTGLEVSRICLGCMSYGAANQGNHAWSLNEEESRPFIKRALEAGINFFDTANRYSLGNSEEILGRAIKDFTRRDEVVIATKIYGRMRPGPNCAGLSRKAVLAKIDASLTRLGMDYVDLYQIHRWDYDTPIEETLEALHDIVKAGKARYIGASSMHAWQFARALGIAEKHGWTRFVSMQNLVNLLYREEEREMLPASVEKSVARAENVRGALLLVSRHKAPLGIVYATDVAADPGVKVVGVFPPETHPPIVYPIALVSENQEPAAQRLLEFLTSAAAKPIFEKHGFTVGVE